MCTDQKNCENDIIYNALVPIPEELAAIDKLVVATPIHIHDVYGAPEVQKTIGQEFFIKLVPLSVRESASVGSKVENMESAEEVARSALDRLGVKEGSVRFKAMAGCSLGSEEEAFVDRRRWEEDIPRIEERDGVDSITLELTRLKENISRALNGIERELETKSRECEVMRVKYQQQCMQDPSAGLPKALRQDLKKICFSILTAVAESDAQVQVLLDSVRSDIQLLLSPNLDQVFHEREGFNMGHPLNLGVSGDSGDVKERQMITGYVMEIEEKLGRLAMFAKDRTELLRDLENKVILFASPFSFCCSCCTCRSNQMMSPIFLTAEMLV